MRQDDDSAELPTTFDERGRLVSLRHGDVYAAGGLPETDHVFLSGNALAERFSRARSTFTVGELGFGVGLNFCATRRLFRAVAPASARLYHVAVERDLLPADVVCRALGPHAEIEREARELTTSWPARRRGFVRRSFDDGRVVLCLLLGDVTDILPAWRFRADAWFLDGFAPGRNPDMWTADVMTAIAERCHADATVSTYSVAAAVRHNLAAAGFEIERRAGHGDKREMLVGRLTTPPLDPCPPWQRAPFARAAPDTATVIGAGLAGTGAARALADRGVTVRLIDPAGVGTAASAVPRAVFEPRLWTGDVPDAAIVTTAWHHTRQLLQRLQRQTGFDAFDASGVLRLARNERDAGRQRRQLTGSGLSADHAAWLGAESIRERWGLHAPHGGTWLPTSGHLDPGALCRALADHPNIAFERRVATTDDLSGTHVLTNALAVRDVVPWLPLRPVRGQSTVVTEAAITGPPIVLAAGTATTPPVDGMRCIGATFDRDVTDLTPRPQDDHRNLDALREVAPELAHALDRSSHRSAWFGIRAVTADRLPFVGPVPDEAEFTDAFGGALRGERSVPDRDPRLEGGRWTSTGHGARGVVTGPFGGEVPAAMRCGEPPPLPARWTARLLPARALARRERRARSDRSQSR